MFIIEELRYFGSDGTKYRYRFLLCVTQSHFILSHSAPAGAPQNITATALSSTEIRVDWEPVDAIDRNGIITHYEVRFNRTTFTEILMTNTMNTKTNIFNLILTNLKAFVEYTVTVRAFTTAGVGPYSAIIASNKTEEAGK